MDDAVREACDASSPTIDRIKKEGALFWAIGVSPPFGFEVERGVWTGVEAQNAAELATILGVDFDISEYSYDTLPQAVVTGQADIIGAELFVTDERRKLIDFSMPYYQSGQLFYVLDDSPYETIDDLNKRNVRFVYGTGTAQLELAKKYVPKAKVSDTSLGDRLLLHDVLAADRADATISQAAAMKVIHEKFRHPPLAAIGLNGRVTRRAAVLRGRTRPVRRRLRASEGRRRVAPVCEHVGPRSPRFRSHGQAPRLLARAAGDVRGNCGNMSGRWTGLSANPALCLPRRPT